MLPPATTGFGEATFVTVNSPPAVVPITVEAEAVLLFVFGSVTDELVVTVSVITVPLAVPGFTLVTRINVAAVLPAIFKSVQTRLPLLPEDGVVQFQPVGTAREINTVPAGMASDSVALSAALGPLLVRTCV